MTEPMGASSKQPTSQPRALHLHTLDSLFADLINGNAILVEDDEFKLSSADTRAILNWYRTNPAKWQGRMNQLDAEAIAACVGKTPPTLPGPSVSIGSSAHRLRLARVRVHRFGGLHAYGTEGNPPQDFVFEPNESLTLFEGSNGSGKTSLLNAIVWCLTGKVLRAQRSPADGSEEFDSFVERDGEEGPTTTTHALTSVTPLPSLSSFTPGPDQKIPVDTWVEITFVDEEGKELSPIRRTQTRTLRGKVSEEAPNLEPLGVDPVSFAISATMPAMLQHIQLGQTSDLGKAVSELTGLSGLIDLQRHAQRASAYIKDKLKKSAEAKIAETDNRFEEAARDIRARCEEFPPMELPFEVPTPSARKDLEQDIETLTKHFTDKKSAALDAAKLVLGDAFNAEDATARKDLEENIELARGEIAHISKLESAARLSGLGKLTDAEFAGATALIEQINQEAETLRLLIADPAVAARKQLYAAVASWTIANGNEDDSLCHLCSQPMSEAIDPVTGQLVRVHLGEARVEEPELLSQTIKGWAASRMGVLANQLPAGLRDEREKDLPSSPIDLLESAVCTELFNTTPFAGSLATLQKETAANFLKDALQLPQWGEPEIWAMPEALAVDASSLELAVQRVQRAIGFAKWRRNSQVALVALFASTVGKESAESEQPTTSTSPLSSKLSALQAIVDGALPISDAIEYCGRMSKAIEERRISEKAIENYDTAMTALSELEKLGTLASAQINALQIALEGSASRWRGKIYLAPVSGPSIKRTAMSAAGVLEFQAGAGNISAPAQHISNASALRAGLVGFFLAFREHVLKTRGGLELLILDDPQELLDEHNRSRMAHVIVEIAAGSAQPLLTTYDRSFAMMVAAEASSKCTFNHHSIHGVNAQRETIALGPAKRQLDEDRQAFEKNIDDHILAQRYAATARTYVETRLRDLFDDPAYPAYTSSVLKPSLGDFLNYLRSLVAKPPSELFSHASVTTFSKQPGLVSGSECYGVLNDSHHTPAKVSYGRVLTVASELRAICNGIEDVHRAFRDWRSTHKLPAIVANDNGDPLQAVVSTARQYIVRPNLAAFSGAGAPGPSQEEAVDVFSSTWFDDKSLFYIRSDNFGFAIPKGYIAIVEASPGAARDRNLVIARNKKVTLARRLFMEANGYALAAETPDPRDSPATKMILSNEYHLHRVVGCLLLETIAPTSKSEAVQVSRDKLADEIEAVYRLDKESAVPLALPGQLLLGGQYLLPAEIGQHEGKLAAITLDDGTELLKRIGAAVSTKIPYVRHFETIGGLGQSIILKTEEVEGDIIDVPVILSARIAVGVIYE